MNATIWLFLLLAIGGIGCMSTGGNFAVLRKANLVAIGSMNRQQEPSIFEVSIGQPSQSFGSQFAFSIRLGSARVIRSQDFTLELIQSISTRTNSVDSSSWGIGHVSYGIEGYAFIFQGDRLVEFKAADISLPNGTRLLATLGDPDCKTFSSLPLTREQFQTLFGKPDSEERRKVL